MRRPFSPFDMVLTPRGLRFRGRLYPCSIGRGGLTDRKREGDGATPRAVLRIVGALFRPDRMRRPAPWVQPIGLCDLWSDDAGRGDYNQLVRAPYNGTHESLRRADPLYDLILLTDWNWPEARPGDGSAIFVHRWRRQRFPTAGCIGLPPLHMREVARHAAPGTRLITC